jgi:hypothetical protein
VVKQKAQHKTQPGIRMGKLSKGVPEVIGRRKWAATVANSIRPFQAGFEPTGRRKSQITKTRKNENAKGQKAIKAADDRLFAQPRSYLNATGLHTSLLLNFNLPFSCFRPFVLS